MTRNRARTCPPRDVDAPFCARKHGILEEPACVQWGVLALQRKCDAVGFHVLCLQLELANDRVYDGEGLGTRVVLDVHGLPAHATNLALAVKRKLRRGVGMQAGTRGRVCRLGRARRRDGCRAMRRPHDARATCGCATGTRARSSRAAVAMPSRESTGSHHSALERVPVPALRSHARSTKHDGMVCRYARAGWERHSASKRTWAAAPRAARTSPHQHARGTQALRAAASSPASQRGSSPSAGMRRSGERTRVSHRGGPVSTRRRTEEDMAMSVDVLERRLGRRRRRRQF